MEIDSARPRSRRALLAAAFGGAAAAVAATVGRVSPASADTGDPMTLGQHNTADQGTSIQSTDTGGGLTLNVIAGGTTTALNTEAGDGIAVDAYSDTGLGLRVAHGRTRFVQTSGVATIKAGTRSKTISPGFDINPATFVLLSPMANIAGRALWFSKNTSANSITIHMSSARSSATKVAWLALEKGGWGPEPTGR